MSKEEKKHSNLKVNTHNSKGITLVALIITIIVLLILAVVTIQAVQDDGIINYAKNASEKQGKATLNEQGILNGYVDKMEDELTEKLLPPEYKQIEYIESTGTQYIDTEIIPKNGFGIWMDFEMLTEISKTAASAKLFGTSKKSNGYFDGLFIGSYPTTSGGELVWFGEIINVSQIYNPSLLGKTRIWVQNINNVYTTSTGYSLQTPFVTEKNIYGNLYLFAINYNGLAYTGSGIKLYGCKLYNGESVIKDFIPCYRKSDNKVGLYDTVEGKFYENQGEGDFVAGPEV